MANKPFHGTLVPIENKRRGNNKTVLWRKKKRGGGGERKKINFFLEPWDTEPGRGGKEKNCFQRQGRRRERRGLALPREKFCSTKTPGRRKKSPLL